MNYLKLTSFRRLISPQFVLCSAIYLLIGVSSVFAQTALTGGLRGIVTDSNGAAIAGATVRIENKSLSVRREAVTDADGRFTI